MYDYKHNETSMGYDVHCLGCEATTRSYKRVVNKKEGE